MGDVDVDDVGAGVEVVAEGVAEDLEAPDDFARATQEELEQGALARRQRDDSLANGRACRGGIEPHIRTCERRPARSRCATQDGQDGAGRRANDVIGDVTDEGSREASTSVRAVSVTTSLQSSLSPGGVGPAAGAWLEAPCAG